MGKVVEKKGTLIIRTKQNTRCLFFSIIYHHGLWRKERERKSEKERARKRGRKRERENEETQTCNDRTTTVSKSAACILDSFMNVVKKICAGRKEFYVDRVCTCHSVCGEVVDAVWVGGWVVRC